MVRKKLMLHRSGLLALAVVLVTTAVAALSVASGQAAANSVRMEPTAATVAPGGEVSVDLAADVPDGLGAWSVTVSYDRTVVHLTHCAGQSFCNEPSPGMISIAGFSATGISGSQVLQTLTFGAVGGVGASTALQPEVLTWAAADGPTLDQPATTPGSITVGPASPSATPQPQGTEYWGDVDCGGSVAIGDAQKVARSLIGLAVNQSLPCPAIGSNVTADGTPRLWGDVDCGGGVAIGDAQKIARSLIGLVVNQSSPCPAIGAPVQIAAA